jgi:antitoxin (DNA-binding transcriptional repressor) of toxin-antitoxin stability system
MWGRLFRLGGFHQRIGRINIILAGNSPLMQKGIAALSRGHLPLTKIASGSYIQIMRSVGLKTLKNKLSEYVRLAAGGETVLPTDRDRVVVEIGPPSPTRSPILSDALLCDAFRQGWMTPPISVGRGPPVRKPVMMIDELLSPLGSSSKTRMAKGTMRDVRSLQDPTDLTVANFRPEDHQLARIRARCRLPP